MAHDSLCDVGDAERGDDSPHANYKVHADDDPFDDDGPRARKLNRTRRESADARRRARLRDAVEERRPRERPVMRRQRPGRQEEFRCRHCRAMVGPVPSGGRHRNHCPVCLHSRHVDDRLPGDRGSTCGATMAPIGAYTRSGGEYGLEHRCLQCGVVRHNRIAADDNFALVMALPDVTSPVPSLDEREIIPLAQRTTA